MRELTLGDIDFVVETMAKIIVDNEVAFCELDSVAGDGDFGMSLAKGFRIIQAEWAQIPRDDIGAFLRGCGMIILEHCGGASGPIWGGAFTAAGRSVKGKGTLSLADTAELAAAAVAAIQKKGGAKRGDKTLLDALIPAAESLADSAGRNADLPDALAAAAAAAVAGAEETKTMVASRGRASYVGERSLTHPDAGASALGVIFTGIVDALRGRK